jgi:2-polyprenyl-3-methyl-5-hydroxy-6-metoxy-1,4-benzoquinol methylase
MGSKSWRADTLAAAAHVNERYLVEWLSAMAAFGLVRLETDAADGEHWRLSKHLAPYLTAETESTLDRMSATVVGAANQMVRLVEPFRHGGGLSYAERAPSLSEAFEQDANANYRGRVVDCIVPSVPGLVERLRCGVTMADLGCGAAHALEHLARAFPRSHFIGFDAAEESVRNGSRRLRDRGVGNVELHACAIEELPAASSYEVVCAFEVVHNLPDPEGALAKAWTATSSGGMFFMYETNSFGSRERNLKLPWAGPIYTMSLLSCLTVSLAHDGAGYGAMWGVETAERMLANVGFKGIGHREVISDPVHLVIWGTR